ncbi:hypothetical protein HG535_0E02030 [Zygotorulaspora mrakii]|uniref:Signal peptidase complex subunit 2 n=1 Tax=Zygotorulaspora mrakii TaxID=42260 RepID=A0A7H9B569_ZYGMR|nr:uncharacterized protein HG535_0E02030 [Zygotorulaspora mrakii]QLG73119.1 hypothetical protein HG535_0E02030 [Zygotorulaspora mrakii]
MSKPINSYSIPELRQTLDESLPVVFAKLNYKQSFGLIDGKLSIGYLIAVVAAASFFLDKKFAYKEVVGYQTLLVGAYTILSIAFWYYTKYVEKGIKYIGIKKDGNRLYVKTDFEDGRPEYQVELKNGKGVELKIALPVNEVFNEAGYLQNNLFYQWVEKQVKNLETKKTQ